jgi:transposase
MRTAIPALTADADDLTQRLQRDHDGPKKPRLQRCYLLRSGQAQTRREVARLLGLLRNTVGHWLAQYATGGLEALLAVYVPAGKCLSLAPAVWAGLEHALRRPAGFASYEELRLWVRQTQGVEVKYTRLYTIVRTRFRTRLKVPRPSHTQKEAIPEFQSTCHER